MKLNKLNKRPRGSKREPAASPGSAVSRGPEVEVAPEPVKEEIVWNLDAQPDWIDRATVEGQIQIKGAFKHDRTETLVFDLTLPEELKSLNELQTKSKDPFTNTFIMQREQHFCEKTGNWKVLLTVSYVKYKRMVKGTKKPQQINL